MKIVMRDGRVFQGTGLQIVKAMRDVAFDVNAFTPSEYMDWLIENASKNDDTELCVQGQTDEERANSLVVELIRTGLARQ